MWVIKKDDGELLKSTYVDKKGKIHKKVLFFNTRYEVVSHIIRECGNSPYLHEELWRE